jgi:hypothetical protein
MRYSRTLKSCATRAREITRHRKSPKPRQGCIGRSERLDGKTLWFCQA